MLRLERAALLGIAGLAALLVGMNPPSSTPPGDLSAVQGYWKPLSVEFWRSRPDRLHVRELYTRQKPGAPWSMQLLNP